MDDNEAEGIRLAEEGLKVDLQELRTQIEENDLVYGIPSKGMSSLHVPKDAEYFRRERKLILTRTLQVSQAMPIQIQAEIMKEEMTSSTCREYNEKTLPLLIHQHFIDRMHELVICKHSHLLRWKRYCINTAVVESIYPDYKSRVESIMEEYMDCSSRAYRLAVAREGYLQRTDQGIDELTVDDMLIYMRWLVSHLHSMKLFMQISRLLQWFPLAHRNDVTPLVKEDSDLAVSSSADEEATASGGGESDGMMRLHNATDTRNPPTYSEAIPHPPPMVAAAMTGHNPLTPTQFNLGLAAAGGGLATDEKNRALPMHTNDLVYLRPHLIVFCNVYNVTVDVNAISSSADEMELFAAINRKFRHLFNHQEMMRTFQTYDYSDGQNDKWGLDSSAHALLKEANWLDFVKFKPRKDADLVKKMTDLRSQNCVDELLRAASHFVEISDPDKVQDALRHHALLVQHPPVIHTASVVTNRQGLNTSEIFKKIYTNPELYSQSGSGDGDDKGRKRRNSYDFQQTMQMLGLEDQDKTKDDPSSVQGAYLSYLHLRHLKIRDVQRTCLSILNYFRSIERTLTINDQGLSMGSNTEKSAQNHRVGSELDGHQGGGNNLGGHGYLFNSPRDFKVAETEFVQFAEVLNHDDFYFHEEGRLHVRDQVGYYVVYKAAITDLKKMKDDLMLIASQYIERDRQLRSTSLFKRKRTRADQESSQGDFDISQYAHREIDRFGVLYDIWSNHTSFMECKKNLMDIYMEAYQNTFSRDERRRLGQVMFDLMHQQPRLDFNEKYFVVSYRLECAVMRLKANFMKRLLDRQIEEMREYRQKMTGDMHGLPLNIITKNPIACNADENALRSVFLLEFHPSLTIASHVTVAMERTYLELHNMHRPKRTIEEVQLEKRMFEVLLYEWRHIDKIGASYSSATQKDLFADHFVEHPVMMTELAQTLSKNIDNKNTRGDKRSRKVTMITGLGRLFDLICTRFRLIDCTWQCEVLAKLYRHQAIQMGYDDFHLYLRFIQFETAKKKDGAESSKPPLYITSIQEDDTAVDKFQPSALPLAIHEMDESQVGRFSFKASETILQLVEGSGLENLMVILKSQVAHKNGLVSGVLLAHNCKPSSAPVQSDSGRVSPQVQDTRSEKSSTTGLSTAGGAGLSASSMTHMRSTQHSKLYDPEAFFSLQLEKTPSRDRMMNQYISKTTSTPSLLKNPVEGEKLKRELISRYCDDFGERVTHASLRAQIVAYYNSIHSLLDMVPNVRTNFFTTGDPFEKKTENDDQPTTESEPRSLRKRPRRLLSADGKQFLNLWFLPHYTEVLFLYKQLDDEQTSEALRLVVKIIGAFHDILHYLVAHARLGTCKARLTSEQKSEFVTSDWGGTEGIGTELREIQRQLDGLEDPLNPALVSEMLILRRNAMFLEFDVCVRHILRETFLASGNLEAYNAVTENMHFALTDISDAQRPAVFAVQLNVPEPMEARDARAKELFPWRSWINTNGPFPALYPPWYRIEYNLQLCLAGLRNVDRPVVHGELLALNLCLEDLLTQGKIKEIKAGRRLSLTEADEILLLGKRYQDKGKKKETSRPASGMDEASAHAATPVPSEAVDLVKRRLSTTSTAIEAYDTICKFLVLWKRLDLLKYEWGRRKMQLESIDTPTKYRNFCKLYKSEKLYPLMKSLAVQYGQGHLYDVGPIADTDMFITPKGVPEAVVRQRQLLKLLETFEFTMINDVRKRILRQTDLVIKERNREEGNLPVDLWKRPAMKEVISVKRPTIAEDFLLELMRDCEEDEDTKSFTFSKEHLDKSLQHLVSLIMVSQREIYENYAMYYENMMKHQHQLLYDREREIKEVREQLKARELSTVVDVQFQLADQAHSLLLEVTALRAKLAEMRENALNQEERIRQEVKEEYNEMVQNLFSVSFEQKARIDEYREHLHEATLKRIQEVRTEAAVEMSRVKEKSGAKATADDELAERNLQISKKMTQFHQRNIALQQMMIRMRSLFNWRETFSRCEFQKKICEVQQEKDQHKVKVTYLEMLSEQKSQLLSEELTRLKKYLTTTEKELNDLRKKLDREMKEKMEKRHAAERKAASDKQLAMVKQMHIDELMNEIADKDGTIHGMTDQLDQNSKSQKSVVDRSYREVDTLKKNLREERKLKQSAFGKVDDLLSQVYEFETALAFSRGTTSVLGPSQSRPPTTTAVSRSTPQSRPSTGLRPGVRLPQKSLTPELRLQQHDRKTRPKTVSGTRLRSRIAEQLLYNIEPDHHDTLTKLEDGRTSASDHHKQAT